MDKITSDRAQTTYNVPHGRTLESIKPGSLQTSRLEKRKQEELELKTKCSVKKAAQYPNLPLLVYRIPDMKSKKNKGRRNAWGWQKIHNGSADDFGSQNQQSTMITREVESQYLATRGTF